MTRSLPVAVLLTGGCWLGACGSQDAARPAATSRPVVSTGLPPTTSTTLVTEATSMSTSTGRASVRTSGGTVEASSRGGVLEVLAVTPADGWVLDAQDRDGQRLTVTFTRQDARGSVEVTLEATSSGIRQSTVQRIGSEA